MRMCRILTMFNRNARGHYGGSGLLKNQSERIIRMRNIICHTYRGHLERSARGQGLLRHPENIRSSKGRIKLIAWDTGQILLVALLRKENQKRFCFVAQHKTSIWSSILTWQVFQKTTAKAEKRDFTTSR